MGCAGAWSLHPNQIAIAKRVFSPDPKEVKFAKRILEAMPDGTGVAMLDGKMQDDATWKQAKVIVDLARSRSPPRTRISRRSTVSEDCPTDPMDGPAALERGRPVSFGDAHAI
jgi:hypothetical protein